MSIYKTESQCICWGEIHAKLHKRGYTGDPEKLEVIEYTEHANNIKFTVPMSQSQ